METQMGDKRIFRELLCPHFEEGDPKYINNQSSEIIVNTLEDLFHQDRSVHTEPLLPPTPRKPSLIPS